MATEVNKSIEANKECVRRFFRDVYDQHNLAAIDAYLATDQVDHTLPTNLPPTTAGTKRAVEMFLRTFPNLQVTLDDLVAEGDRVAIRFTSHGTPRGMLRLLSWSRKPVAVSSYLTVRIADGKIVEQWGLDDRLAMLRQLGIIRVLLGGIFLAGLGAGAVLTMLTSKISTSHGHP